MLIRLRRKIGLFTNPSVLAPEGLDQIIRLIHARDLPCRASQRGTVSHPFDKPAQAAP
jgi:hypothetical protein